MKVPLLIGLHGPLAYHANNMGILLVAGGHKDGRPQGHAPASRTSVIVRKQISDINLREVVSTSLFTWNFVTTSRRLIADSHSVCTHTPACQFGIAHLHQRDTDAIRDEIAHRFYLDDG